MTPDPLRQLRTVWAALVGGVVVYTGLLFALTTAGVVEIATVPPSVMNPVGAAVMVYLAVAVVLRRRMVSRIPRDLPAEDRWARYQVATLVSLALMEGGGLIVITLGLVAGAPTWILAGGATSAALMVLARPSADDLGP